MRAGLFVLLLGWPLALTAADSHACISPEEAPEHVGKKVCVRAHVYDVAEVENGTRYIDVCAPAVADEKCGFYIVSFKEDAERVGNLEPLRNGEIELRGTVREYRGRAEMVLNDERQLHGGEERFHANPALSRFDASTGHVAFRDPSATATVKASGGFSHRSSAAHRK